MTYRTEIKAQPGSQLLPWQVFDALGRADAEIAEQTTEIQRLRDELELCSQLKREYQERAAKAACGEVVVDVVKGFALGLSNAFEKLADEEHDLRTRLGWKRFFSVDWWAVHSFRRD